MANTIRPHLGQVAGVKSVCCHEDKLYSIIV